MAAASAAPIIRPAVAADTDQLRALARDAYGKYVPRLNREPAPMNADFAAHVAAAHAVVIDAAGAIAGYMIAWPEPDAYFVDNLAVAPAHQGHGLGRRLLDHARAEALRLDLPALRLHTNVAMTENLAIYRHIGFVETHRGIHNGYNRAYLRLDLSSARR
jgi:ribosomal protein S18 acetylase RimI-like enzyme